ncbi:hypothetical protein EAI_16453 [Harpegnathos saltator]|uniref:Kin17 KOW domain-containing protein n=1 Tax=Harpegnathos saltator TaxID=610380 RepID=E2C5J5_HARSA|nr:hypothetical protein EAI_16453 [Harpegnathos saltator]
MDKDDEERLMDFIEKQIQRAKQDIKEEENETSKIPLTRPENDAPLVLEIKLKPKPKFLPILNMKQKIRNEDINEDTPVPSDKYYKAEDMVQTVGKDSFIGKVKLKTPEEINGHIELDQEYLETVIPAIGMEVLILWGKHKGKKAVVKELHIDHYSIVEHVELEQDKTIVEMLPYEQVSKYINI